MRGTGFVVGLAAALALSGCGREEAGLEEYDRTGAEELATAADTSEAFRDTTANPVVPVQGAPGITGGDTGGPITATGNLRGPADDAPRGSVTLTEANGGTRVLVDITRYTAGTPVAASLATGACDVTGARGIAVGEPMTVGRAGIATLEGTVPIPIVQVLDGRHSIQVHAPDNPPPAVPLACADLPRLDR